MIELRIPYSDIETETHEEELDYYFTNHIFSWIHVDYFNVYIFPLKRYDTIFRGGATIISFKNEIHEWLSNLDIDVEFTYEPYGEYFTITFNRKEDAILFKMTWM